MSSGEANNLVVLILFAPRKKSSRKNKLSCEREINDEDATAQRALALEG
jgi:hypothetical protein